MKRRISVGPFNRVEGDLEVQLEFAQNRVSKAWVVSPLYRGFEQMLQGKAPLDALVYTPRICGICSVAQSVASAFAIADAAGVKMPPNGETTVNLILANENIADHLTHFYMFFMPDFAREIYQTQPWFEATVSRFKAIKGSVPKDVLPARAQFMHMMGLLAGKWPHSHAIQPTGCTRIVKAEEKVRLLGILHGFRSFLETRLFGDQLDNILAIDSADALQNWQNSRDFSDSDFAHFLHISQHLQLDKLGVANNNFMSYGVYPTEGESFYRSGIWDGQRRRLNSQLITEDVSHGWMHQEAAKHPFDGTTRPDADAKNGYTWCKAPRLDGQALETGALARQLVNGNALMLDLVKQSGGNVQNRIIARLLEIAQLVVEMDGWVRSIRPDESFYNNTRLPDTGQGSGLIEAARGSLGHWIKIKKGRIQNYQIIAPTTWNFSPRDQNGLPGPLEQALIGAARAEGEQDPVAVQHIVRSFDPCMVCTVH